MFAIKFVYLSSPTHGQPDIKRVGRQRNPSPSQSGGMETTIVLAVAAILIFTSLIFRKLLLEFFNYVIVVHTPWANFADKEAYVWGRAASNIKWYPHVADLNLVRQAEQGLVFFVEVNLTRQGWLHRLPRGFASSSPAHVSLNYGCRFASYSAMFRFEQRAREMLAQEQLRGQGVWLYITWANEGRQWMIGENSCGGVLLARIQELLPDHRHMTDNLHISTVLFVQRQRQLQDADPQAEEVEPEEVEPEEETGLVADIIGNV